MRHVKFTGKHKFKHLIDTLRQRSIFKQKYQIDNQQDQLAKGQQQQGIQHELIPITQVVGLNSSTAIKNTSIILQSAKIVSQQQKHHQNHKSSEISKNNDNHLILSPSLALKQPSKEQLSGMILKQKSIFNPRKTRYIKLTKTEINNKESKSQCKKVSDIDPKQMIQFFNKEVSLNTNSSSQQIKDYCLKLKDYLNLTEDTLFVIKKYNNCIYYGQDNKQTQEIVSYEGFVFYFNEKIYYGQFLKGKKHGYGTQIDFAHNKITKGYYFEGKQSGYFQIQDKKYKYEGQLLNGLYNGKGKLLSQNKMYEGMFKLGKKQGYGEQVTQGISLKGYFKHDVFQNLQNPQFQEVSQVNSEKTVRMERNKTRSSEIVEQNVIINKRILLNSSTRRQGFEESRSIIDEASECKPLHRIEPRRQSKMIIH